MVLMIRKKSKEVFEEMILPLIDANIFEVLRYTKKMLSEDLPNMFIDLNPALVPSEEEMHLKRLKVFQSSKK